MKVIKNEMNAKMETQRVMLIEKIQKKFDNMDNVKQVVQLETLKK